MAIIKTPDQKVRVFISSTINELAEERKAARQAISNLRLTPVFFEAGARPHPPRDLYAAYLEQSHIFLGIYWNSYGWVAPGAHISGLEDEYRLCGKNKPKLIYVKESLDRQPKLNDLLHDIQSSETACYQKFKDAAELQSLIENDLSILMSETFENALFNASNKTEFDVLQKITAPEAKKILLPANRPDIIGRETDIKNLCELLNNPSVNLVNILGAGGTGKTTIAVQVAHVVTNQFTDGALFVSLAPVTDANLVASAIADTLELQDNGNQDISKTLMDYLLDKNMLLVLDNFEQILDAASLINNIIDKCRGVKVLVTSRSMLNLSKEHIYNLHPLYVPGEEMPVADNDFLTIPSVALFIHKAKAVNNQLQLDIENKQAIAAICNKLDGLPLAIELAASRTKLFQPAVLIKRMDKLLDLTSKGKKDLPHRQQTLRNTIEWSYNLLDTETRNVFMILGIFKRSWTFEAADTLVNAVLGNTIDIEEAMEKLLNVSLVKPVLASHDSEPRFDMLQTVFEFSGDALRTSDIFKKTQKEYIQYFRRMLQETKGKLWSSINAPLLDKIEYEYQNIRAAYYFAIDNKDYESAWCIFQLITPYWTICGGFSEALSWMTDAGIDDLENADRYAQVSTIQKAETHTWAAFVKFMMMQIEPAYKLLYSAEKYALDCNSETTYCLALCMDGCYGAFLQYADAGEKIVKTKALCDTTGNILALAFYYIWSYQYYMEQGAYDIIFKNIEFARKLASEHSLSYISGNIYLVNYSLALMQENINASEIYEQSLLAFNELPDKGYTGLKAATLGGMTYALLRLQRYDEVWPVLKKVLEYMRHTCEKEGEFYSLIMSAHYFAVTGKYEMAYIIFGSVDAFMQQTSYPLVGPSSVQYNDAKTAVFGDKEISGDTKRLYEKGWKMPLEETIIYALKNDV